MAIQYVPMSDLMYVDTYDVILHVIHDILHIMNAEIGLERSTLSFLLTYYNICLQSVF